MKRKTKGRFFIVVLILLVLSAGNHRLYAAETRISIGVTETMETFNPYGDSVSLMYSVWCMILGCLGTYDFDKGQHVGLLVEKWEVKDPKTWLFHLRKNNRFHDGSPVTAEDVVHSIRRTRSDPYTKQFQNVSAVAGEAALDKYTVRITTKEPTAPLLDYLFDRIIVTSKAVYDKYGPEEADRHPVGAGPYKFRELIPGQRLVIGKDKSHPMWKQYPQAPDEIVFRIMREPEQRVTALLNARACRTEPAAQDRQISHDGDHVSGDDAEGQTVGQQARAPGRCIRYRSRHDHQDFAQRGSVATGRSDRRRAIRL